MPWGSVKLIPGVNVERTPTLLEAGYATSQLIRFRDGLAQKYGGWSAFFVGTVGGIPRDMHAWQDLNGNMYLAVATTTKLQIVKSGVLSDITPQTLTTNPAVSVSTIANSTIVSAIDPGISPSFAAFGLNPSAITGGVDAIVINVPVSIGGIVVSGMYFSATNVGAGGPGVHLFAFNAVNPAVSQVNGMGAVPLFNTTSGSSFVKVTLNNHGLIVGQTVSFNVSTTGQGVTISGAYVVTQQVVANDANAFYIQVSTTATGTGSFSMNGGNAQFQYLLGTGYYSGEQTGSVISGMTDWTQDNWGQILLSCPFNGPIYQWTPGIGTTANPVGSAPAVNGGIFVSNAQQVLIAWASSGPNVGGVGYSQNSLQVAWSTTGDYTNFIPTSTNVAGAFVIPSGTTCRGGMAVASQNLIWTDLDLWAMNFLGPPFGYGFNKIGAGAGLIGSHAAQQIEGNVYWMGPTNFYMLSGSGVQIIPCPVWDAVFQNLNTSFQQNVRAMPNTPFSEVGWLYPSEDSVSGECDSYVKFNINEPSRPWDYGLLSRSAWVDQSVLGNPISADTSGNVYQQETTNDANGVAMAPSFTTGYFIIAEGEDFAFVDWVIPDMIWGTYSGDKTASVQITLNVINFPGDTATTYGPYTMTQTTEGIVTRLRGRQMSVTIQSTDLGSFWRLGRIRYRWAPMGRR